MQLYQLHRLATERGWDVVDEVVDSGSGPRANLPGRDRIMRLAQEGLVDIVATQRIDRLGGSVRDFVETVELFRAANVEVASLDDGFDTTEPTGLMMFRVLAAIHHLGRERVGGAIREGMERARREGRHAGRPPKRVDVEQVRQRLADGATFCSVAREQGTSERTVRRALEHRAEASGPRQNDRGGEIR
jgi:DNA invertase Pin-like site-specific DNA recombinase